MQKVMVTLPDELLQQVDAVAKDLKQNRSRFVRQALAERLERISRRKFETLLAEGYQVMAEQDLKDAEAYLGTFQDIGEE
ncbi:MAG: hypothetical protein DRH12_18680 [Deltaproteobacteria bacterium]|nr:MAG: hypothetical protein DRH12_18680 [Deltaproteobacteria bacterium]